MFFIVRHSERLDWLNSDEWKKSKRYKENISDTPLTKHGKVIAERAIKDILKEYTDFDYIYSSPFSRCIETSLVIQNEIKKETGKNIKIRIEYGLSEVSLRHVILNTPDLWKIKNKEFVIDKNKENTYSKKKYVDSQQTLTNIIKRYGNHFDKTYKPIISYKNMNFDKTRLDGFNRAINVYNKIVKNTPKGENAIISTHGQVIFSIYSIITNDDWKSPNPSKFFGPNFCATVGFERNKSAPIYGPHVPDQSH